MSLTTIIIQQAVIMLFLITIGIVIFKVGLLTKQGSKELSSLVIKVVNPIVILMAYQREMDEKLVKGLLIAFGLSLGAFLITIAIAYILIRKKEGTDFNIDRFSIIYTNCGFMGIPLVNALFGDEGVFYLTAFITLFNILIWTHGLVVISGKGSFKAVIKAFLSPSLIAVAVGIIMFAFQIMLPEILAEGLNFVKELNTPLAMFVAGATIAQTNILKALKKPRIYIITVVKLLVVPIVVLILFSFIPVDDIIKLTVVVAMAAPTATICTLFCLEYDKNSLYAAEIFAVTTLASMITLPLIIMLNDFIG